MKKVPIGFRLSKALINRLKAAAKVKQTTVTALIERGAELVAREAERKQDAR